MAALDGRASGKMGMRAVVYYTTTTVIAVIIGIIMVLIIHPGKGSKDEFTKQQKIEQISPADAFLDLIRYLLTHLCSFNNQTRSQFCQQKLEFIIPHLMPLFDSDHSDGGAQTGRSFEGCK